MARTANQNLAARRRYRQLPFAAAKFLQNGLRRVTNAPDGCTVLAVNHAQHVTAGRKLELTRLSRQVDLRHLLTALHVPDTHSTIKIRHRNTAPGGSERYQCRRAGDG